MQESSEKSERGSQSVASKRRQQPRVPNFISEAESNASSFKARKQQKYASNNMMRKLRQLWNKQRYLTDDQCQSSIGLRGALAVEDSSMDYERENFAKQFQGGATANFLKKTQHKSYPIKSHERVVSSSDQRQILPQKMKKNEDSKQEMKEKESISIKVATLQIASVSSAFQDQSQNMNAP